MSSRKSSPRTSPTGSRLPVLKFLRDLLDDESNSDIIMWTNQASGEFRLVKPHVVAAKWGDATNNPTMNYDKMSRGLRFLYKDGTGPLKKMPGKDSRYKFVDSSVSFPFLDFSQFGIYEQSNSSSPETKPAVAPFNIDNLLADPSRFIFPSSVSSDQQFGASSSSSPSTSLGAMDSMDSSQVIINQTLYFFSLQSSPTSTSSSTASSTTFPIPTSPSRMSPETAVNPVLLNMLTTFFPEFLNQFPFLKTQALSTQCNLFITYLSNQHLFQTNN